MAANIGNLSIGERIRIVEDIWDSIAADQSIIPLTDEQEAELNRRLDAYELDRNIGREVSEVVENIID